MRKGRGLLYEEPFEGALSRDQKTRDQKTFFFFIPFCDDFMPNQDMKQRLEGGARERQVRRAWR